MIFRDLEQKIVQDLNTSGMPIDAVYFIMKTLMQEVEQRYFEFCRQEDVAAAQEELESDEKNKESSSEEETPVSAEEGDKLE